MIRRPTYRSRRSQSIAQLSPLAVMDKSTLLQYCNTGSVALAAGLVSTWFDQGPRANHYTQAGPVPLPIYVGSDPTLRGLPTILVDGSQELQCANLQFGAKVFIWGVARQDVWASPASLCGPLGGAGNIAVIQQQTVSPQLRQSSPTGANVNGGAAIGQWFRFEAWFNNDVTDYLKIRGTKVSGQNAGDPTNTLGVLLAGAIAGNKFTGAYAEMMYASALPDDYRLRTLDKYVSAKYGASLVA